MIRNVVKVIQPLKTKIAVPTSVKSYIQTRNVYDLEKKKKNYPFLLLGDIQKRKFMRIGINMNHILLMMLFNHQHINPCFVIIKQSLELENLFL